MKSLASLQQYTNIDQVLGQLHMTHLIWYALHIQGWVAHNESIHSRMNR